MGQHRDKDGVLLTVPISALNHVNGVAKRSVAWYKNVPVYDRLDQYDKDMADAIDDLNDVIEWLKEDKLYDQADRVRTIAGRLARARRTESSLDNHYIRNMARGWK